MLPVVIRGEDRNCFCDSLGFRGASGAALLPLCVKVVACGLQIPQELHISGALLTCQGQILLRVRQSLLVCCILSLHLIKLLLASVNFSCLCCGQGLVVCLCSQLIFLLLRQLSLELLEHLIHDIVDTSRSC